jgi:glycosyltransferase involved in cell wall biosynthesis
MPEVSIIIPNYNSIRFIHQAIQSALDQTCTSYEIIVVDDGSTDASREELKKYGDRIRYIWQENQGLGGARNTGIRAAKGEWIGLLDADDQWQPNFLEKMISTASSHPSAAILYCLARCMDVDGKDLDQTVGGPVLPPGQIYQVLLRNNYLIPSTILMRRSTIVDAGLFDASLRSCEDWDLWLRLLPDQLFVGIDECLVRYRIHGSSLSTNLDGMQKAASEVIHKKFGADDDSIEAWSDNKRRAFGGLYRYKSLTYIQRQENWQAAVQPLRRALRVDASLALDLNLFYDIALGSQPVGIRGTAQQLKLEQNARQIENLLQLVFEPPLDINLKRVRRQTYATSHFAIGLIAYNTQLRQFCRLHFLKAFYYRPALAFDRRLFANLLKSFVPPTLMVRAKKIKSALLSSEIMRG